MRKSVYSAARRGVGQTPAPEEPRREPSAEKPRAGLWRRLGTRYEKALLAIGGALVALAVVLGQAMLADAPRRVTQDDIDAAVARTLQKHPLPSHAVKAYQAVRASIVRVRAVGAAGEGASHDATQGNAAKTRVATGSGVVIVNRGIILTSLHVVKGASRLQVLFANGLESEAILASAQPEHDLAVLRATQIPDDLKAATLGSAKDLLEGQHVTAVGFPFGIGPSVSAGVVSGLRREYEPGAGREPLHDLIQFDAAVNPGSSGGPLVNASGEVVGIVTALLSPGDRAAFSGIAFAVPIETAAGAAGLPPF
jgi:S1-C subfamily serine protease